MIEYVMKDGKCVPNAMNIHEDYLTELCNKDVHLTTEIQIAKQNVHIARRQLNDSQMELQRLLEMFTQSVMADPDL